MRKSYLLAGSLGLLGAMAQVFPAAAAGNPVTVPTTETATASALSTPNPVVSFENSSKELLAVKPEATSTATPAKPVAQAEAGAVSQPAPFADNLVAQGAPVTSVSQLADVQTTDWA
ncbi:MAG TPA: hypothetical protein V6D03_11545, partial [Candidatus Caenarcaniphilales bacterium]